MALQTSGTRITIRADITETNTSAGVNAQGASLKHVLEYIDTLANGTSADQIDVVWSDDGSVTAGTPVDLDLAGTLTSKLATGTTLTYVEICGIFVQHYSGAGNLVVGAGSNPLTTIWIATGDGSVIGPGGMFVWYSPTNGAAVTAGTGDILRLTSSTGTITYRVVLIGRSA